MGEDGKQYTTPSFSSSSHLSVLRSWWLLSVDIESEFVESDAGFVICVSEPFKTNETPSVGVLKGVLESMVRWLFIVVA